MMFMHDRNETTSLVLRSILKALMKMTVISLVLHKERTVFRIIHEPAYKQVAAMVFERAKWWKMAAQLAKYYSGQF